MVDERFVQSFKSVLVKHVNKHSEHASHAAAAVFGSLAFSFEHFHAVPLARHVLAAATHAEVSTVPESP